MFGLLPHAHGTQVCRSAFSSLARESRHGRQLAGVLCFEFPIPVSGLMRTDTSFTPAHPAGGRRQLNRLGARFDERPAEATHQRERKHGLAAAAGQRIPTPANSSRPYRNFLAPDRYRSFLPLQSLSNPSLSAPAAPAPALRSGV